MECYFSYFPDKAKTECRTATFYGETGGIPPGTYFFNEFYCTDLSCDCRRVLIKVYRAESPTAEPTEVATINYQWNDQARASTKNAELMKRVLGLDLTNPFLDPLHYQSSFASELMEFWHGMITQDEAYANRLQRHYQELRAALPQGSHSQRPSTATIPTATPTLTKRQRAQRLKQAKLRRQNKPPDRPR